MPQPGNTRRLTLQLFGICACILVGCAAVAWAVLEDKHKPTTTPVSSPAILQQVRDFTPYFYPSSDIPLGYKTAVNTISYEQGVLFITLHNPKDGQTLALTEQAVPIDFANAADVVGDENITGADGKATISHRDNRVIAIMISRDKKTLIMLTGSAGSSSTVMADLIRALKPVVP